MMARKRYGKGRQSSMRTRAGIATALVVGGGSIVAVAVASQGTTPVARPAAYAARFGNEGTALNSALDEWGQSTQTAYAQLARLTQVRQFGQASHAGKTLDAQRGIVVLATKKFLILASSNGSLHLWLLSGGTEFKDVSSTTAGMAALTASTSATKQAMESGNMIPATTLMAGSPTVAADLLTPTPAAQTVSVQVANTDLTVTVTVTRSTATVSQTATTPSGTTPSWSPSTYTQSAWLAADSMTRGDLALVVGSRSHWLLHAKLVLFSPLSTATVGGRAAVATATPTAAPTSW
jgi:ribosomal protein S11